MEKAKQQKTMQVSKHNKNNPGNHSHKKSTSGNSLRARLIEKPDYYDYSLVAAIILLTCFGLIMLYSTSAYTAQVENGNDMFYFMKQAIIGAVGILIMLAVSKIDYHIYAAFHTEIFLVAMVLMALVKTPLGMELNGARRWIQLPGNMSLQPAEVTKIAVILFISYKLCEYGKKAYGIRGWLKIGAYGVVAAGGVFVLTDNLSTAIIILGIGGILIFVSNPKYMQFIGLGGAGLSFIAVFLAAESYRLERLAIWRNPEKYEKGFQTIQGLYAIGSGGIFGRGLGSLSLIHI